MARKTVSMDEVKVAFDKVKHLLGGDAKVMPAGEGKCLLTYQKANGAEEAGVFGLQTLRGHLDFLADVMGPEEEMPVSQAAE